MFTLFYSFDFQLYQQVTEGNVMGKAWKKLITECDSNSDKPRFFLKVALTQLSAALIMLSICSTFWEQECLKVSSESDKYIITVNGVLNTGLEWNKDRDEF